MDNKEILKAMHKHGEAGYGTAMELARQDEREKWRPHLLDSVLTDAEFKEYTGSEREKMQGVDCWVSWGVNELYGAQPQLSASEPTIECKPNGDVSYIQQNHDFTGLGLGIVGLFNISPGQCKKVQNCGGGE